MMALIEKWALTLLKVILALFILFVFASELMAYQGQKYAYILFSLIFNGLLLFGFRKKRSYFECFLGCFFWLGFWLKFSLRMAFFEGHFVDPIGLFNFSARVLDETLLCSSVAALAVILSGLLKDFLTSSKHHPICFDPQFEETTFYQKYRTPVLCLLVLGALCFAIVNLRFGLYQRGMVPAHNLPFGLNGIFTWMLTFGLASAFAFLMPYELKSNPNPYLLFFFALFEGFCSNLSMLSRSMILNAASLFIGTQDFVKKNRLKTLLSFKITMIFSFVLLFLFSVVSINYLRIAAFNMNQDGAVAAEAVATHTKMLIIDRWVGIEGVMAVVAYPKKGSDLIREAWTEKISPGGTSFYDLKIAETSPYKTMDSTKNHFISLPGIVAFLFYSGSFFWVFIGMFLAACIGNLLEFWTLKVSSGNLILAALIGQIVAFRFVHFGYAPSNSYAFFGTIVINMLIILIIKCLMRLSIKSLSTV